MMKRLISLILALLLAFALAGCKTVPHAPAPVPQQSAQELTLLPPAEPPEELAPVPTTPGDSVGDAQAPPDAEQTVDVLPQDESTLAEDGSYYSKEDVALYIHLYGHLPDNFITKGEAQALGWRSGSLEPYAPGKCIGGNQFGNYEGLLPDADGRVWTECDIDTLGAGTRGAKRIVFSNDGLVYYTGDHYQSFELLYGEE